MHSNKFDLSLEGIDEQSIKYQNKKTYFLF